MSVLFFELIFLCLCCAASWAVSVYFAYQRTWKPFNPILGETYEMVNHQGIRFLAEQVRNLWWHYNYLFSSQVEIKLAIRRDCGLWIQGSGISVGLT